MGGIKITYNIDSDEWTDNQFEDQDSQEFIITTQMICEIIKEKVLTKGFRINEIENIEKF